MSDEYERERKDSNTNEPEVDEWLLMQAVTKETLKIEGVSRFAVSLTDNLSKNLLGRDTGGQGIKFTKDDDELTVDIHIYVRFGINIPAISFEIQTNVKKALEALCELSVEAVNVHIEGVDKPTA